MWYGPIKSAVTKVFLGCFSDFITSTEDNFSLIGHLLACTLHFCAYTCPESGAGGRRLRQEPPLSGVLDSGFSAVVHCQRRQESEVAQRLAVVRISHNGCVRNYRRVASELCGGAKL